MTDDQLPAVITKLTLHLDCPPRLGAKVVEQINRRLREDQPDLEWWGQMDEVAAPFAEPAPSGEAPRRLRVVR